VTRKAAEKDFCTKKFERLTLMKLTVALFLVILLKKLKVSHSLIIARTAKAA